MIYPDKNQQPSRFPFIGMLLLVCGITAGFLIARIFFLSFTPGSPAMKPGIGPGDRVIILKHVTPVHGDIVLLRSPVEPDRALLRRIIAAEGDSVEVKNGLIYVNDRAFRPSWETVEKESRIFPMYFSYRDNMPVIRIKRGEYFVLADNPDLSFDSRMFGVVREEAVIGKSVFTF